ncbi:unnamed protein product [Urochloa decumbens]|uniref:F-box domain-containing protein n=1 Tax=Urochloa decumbens TaxID=240449 RepID=A0ABC9G9P6_9POAL
MEECPDARIDAAATAAGGLPDDALVEILSRVPARSIHRFKCVSKYWRDLIADPLHRKRLPQTLEGFFFSDDAGAGFRGRFISLPGRSAPHIDPSFSFLTKQPGIENLNLLGSCNGLLLFERGSNQATAPDNPATEQWVAVPGCPLDPPTESYFTYLIFDPAVSPHFRLVHFWQKDYFAEIEVRSFSSETMVWSTDMASQHGRWRDEGGWKKWVNGGATLCPTWGSAFVNGMLHLVVYHATEEHMIVALDMEGKVCRVITWPDERSCHPFVGQSQGRLHFVAVLAERGERGHLKWAGLSIWVLEDYDTEEWVLKHRVSYLELFGEMNSLDGFRNAVFAIHPEQFDFHSSGQQPEADII